MFFRAPYIQRLLFIYTLVIHLTNRTSYSIFHYIQTLGIVNRNLRQKAKYAITPFVSKEVLYKCIHGMTARQSDYYFHVLCSRDCSLSGKTTFSEGNLRKIHFTFAFLRKSSSERGYLIDKEQDARNTSRRDFFCVPKNYSSLRRHLKQACAWTELESAVIEQVFLWLGGEKEERGETASVQNRWGK